MKTASGLLIFRRQNDTVEVLLVHPAGPLWAHKDSWSIPKGEHEEAEDHLAAAYREFEEEIGVKPPTGELIDLGSIKAGNKENFIWALEADIEIKEVKSNMFSMEWPPKSGQLQEYPEIDRAEWFDLQAARTKLFKGQHGFLDRLAQKLQLDLPPAADQQSLL